MRVNQKEFDRISEIPHTHLGYEIHTLDGKASCAIPYPVPNEELPNVLKFAKLWKPLNDCIKEGDPELLTKEIYSIRSK